MTKNIEVIKELFKFPEGKQFLAACLITIITLCSVITFMEVRYERNMGKLENCKEEKVNLKQQMVDHLIKDNDREEFLRERELRKKERLDSIEEILRFKRIK